MSKQDYKSRTIAIAKGEYVPQKGEPKVFCESLQSLVLTGQNVVLYGDRPSHATEVFRFIGQSCDAVFVDLGNVKTENEVIDRISRAVERVPGRGRPKQAVRRLLRKIRPPVLKKDWQDGIEDMFAHIQRAQMEKPFVIFLDEFQAVLNCKDSARLVALLRSHIQHQPSIPYIFAGNRQKMYDIFMSPSSPFFKSALPMEASQILG
jgi:hypothetical protein